MTQPPVLLEVRDYVAVLTLNRPERANALSPAVFELFERHSRELAHDERVRAMVVTGAGKAFCSGGDVKQWEESGPAEREQTGSRRDLVTTPTRGLLPFRHFPRPVIAAVNGVAIGAGFALALACDIRIAGASARFTAGFVKRGVAPGSGLSWNLPRLIGTGRALEVLLTGDWVSAQEAERLGIVSRVAPDDQLMPAALELAGRIAANPPIAVELTKRAVWRGQESDLVRHTDLEHYYQQITFKTEDFRESVRSFMEKREPKYKGR